LSPFVHAERPQQRYFVYRNAHHILVWLFHASFPLRSTADSFIREPVPTVPLFPVDTIFRSAADYSYIGRRKRRNTENSSEFRRSRLGTGREPTKNRWERTDHTVLLYRHAKPDPCRSNSAAGNRPEAFHLTFRDDTRIGPKGYSSEYKVCHSLPPEIASSTLNTRGWS
jgi:hypothetical protein